jgi:hypothetical protein
MNEYGDKRVTIFREKLKRKGIFSLKNLTIVSEMPRC